MSRSPHPLDSHEDRGAARNGRTNRFDFDLPTKSRTAQQREIADDHPFVSDRSERTRRVPEHVDSARAHYIGERAYFLRDSEFETLAEVGTFRIIAAPDLARLSYAGDTARMEREIRRLKQQALLSEKQSAAERNKPSRLLALTKQGARLLRKSGRVPDGQAIYHGFAKPREAKHDADLYRLYQAEAERIESAGGRPVRVVLDYELKRNLNRDLEALHESGRPLEVLDEIAERHGLSVVNGKIPVPDLRIEYDTAEMERQRVDLELATRNYRPRALAEKAKAGFSLYARHEDSSRLRRVLEDREITATILSL